MSQKLISLEAKSFANHEIYFLCLLAIAFHKAPERISFIKNPFCFFFFAYQFCAMFDTSKPRGKILSIESEEKERRKKILFSDNGNAIHC